MLLIAVKIAVGFLITVIMFRIIGKRTLKQATPLDMLFVIIIGDLYTTAAADPSTTMGEMILILLLSFTLIYCLDFISKNEKIGKIIEGKTREIIRSGRINCDVLEREKMTVEDVKTELRTQGIWSIEEVELGVLELSGKISVKKSKQGGKVSV